MAVMNTIDVPSDTDVGRVWALLTELSEQLSQNRNASIALHTVTGGVKTQAIHSQTGFVLRRFNQDKSQDEYNAELERMNAQMSSENLALQNENKQLNALIKEYEQALENLMTTFRNRANEVQQRELSIMREYERKILVRETEELSKQLDRDTAFSVSLGRVGRLLRLLMRILGGEDPAFMPTPSSSTTSTPSSSTPGSTSGSELFHPKHIINSLEFEAEEHEHERATEARREAEAEAETEAPAEAEANAETGAETETEAETEEETEAGADADAGMEVDKEAQLAAAEWALERECELARLELENRLLRQLVAEHEGAVTATSGPDAPRELPSLPKLPARARTGKLGGKDVGPFGMYKSNIGVPNTSPTPQV